MIRIIVRRLPASTGGSGARSYALNTLVPAQPGRQTPGSFDITLAATPTSGLSGYSGWGRDAGTNTTYFGSNSQDANTNSDLLGLIRSGTIVFLVAKNRSSISGSASIYFGSERFDINISSSVLSWRTNGVDASTELNIARVRGAVPTVWNNVYLVLNDGTRIPMPSTTPPVPESLTDLPAGITFNAVSRELAVADSTAVGEHALRYTATVGTASKTEDFDVTVEDDDLLTLQSTSFIVHKGADRTVTLPAAAGGDSSNYAYEIVEDPENPDFAARLDSSTRVLTIDDSETSVGRYTLRYTVTDGTQTATAIIIYKRTSRCCAVIFAYSG